MRITPYGVKPYMKMMLARRTKRTGYISLGIPMKGLDTHEEEQ